MALTANNVIFAALLAFVVTWGIKKALYFWHAIGRKNGIGLQFSSSNDVARMLTQCYKMFPLEIIRFNGEVFKRGASVRITTTKSKIFEGKLIGMNSDNIVCMMTKNRIIAHELGDIEEICSLEITELGA